jgi:hypothetical protein
LVVLRVHKLLVLSLAAIQSALVATTATAESVEDFYKGKTITIIVGAGEGGGFDLYARSLAKHLPRYLPGRPNIVVQNRPGASGINAANFVYNVAPQDGSVITTISGSAPTLQLMGAAGPQFDSMKFQWIGNLASDTGAFFLWKTAKVKTFKDAFTAEAILGSFGPNVSEVFPALANNLLGTKFRVVQGYKSGPMVRLAMEKNEVEGAAQTWAAVQSANPDWIAEGRLNVIAQIGLNPDPGLTRMGVPMLMDFVTREHVLPQYSVEQARSYFKLHAVSRAFADVAKDPAFIADLNKSGRPVSPIGGPEIQKLLSEVAATPKEVLSGAKELIKYQGTPK